MRDGVRILNVARGGLIDDAALEAALDAGKVAGAALDVFPSEPITDYPLFRPPERRRDAAPGCLDRGGDRPRRPSERRADRGRADGRCRHDRGQHPFRRCRGDGGAGARSCRSPSGSGASRWGSRRARRSSGSRPRSSDGSRDLDTRLLTRRGAHRRAAGPHRAGRQLRQRRGVRQRARDRRRGEVEPRGAGLQRADPRDRRVRRRARVGRRHRRRPGHLPHLAEVWGSRFMVELERHVSVFRYRDVPGMIGHLGTVFGGARDQHLRRRGRPRAGRRRATRPVRRDGRDDRRARARRGRRRGRRLAGFVSGRSVTVDMSSRPDGAPQVEGSGTPGPVLAGAGDRARGDRAEPRPAEQPERPRQGLADPGDRGRAARRSGRDDAVAPACSGASAARSPSRSSGS